MTGGKGVADKSARAASPSGLSPASGSSRSGIANAVRDWLFARYLKRRCRKRETTICRRRSDGTLWAASSPQRADYAMRGLFSRQPHFHFAAASIWRGIPIVAPKVFWAFQGYGQFDVVEKRIPGFWLEPWPEAIECALLDAQAIEARRAATGTGAVHESAVPEGDAP